MTENEMKTLVERANEIHEQTLSSDNYILQPQLSIKFGGKQFVVNEYWWEDSDFVFVTDKGEEYRCKNAYPISMKFEGLDCTDEECVTLNTKFFYST